MQLAPPAQPQQQMLSLAQEVRPTQVALPLLQLLLTLPQPLHLVLPLVHEVQRELLALPLLLSPVLPERLAPK